MREILFRGKRVDNGEWVYGGIVHQTDYYGYKVDKWFIIDGTTTDDEIGEYYEVIPETVGQHVGKDKWDNDIFDGDILISDFGRTAKVIWNRRKYGWALYGEDTKVEYLKEYKVIGNIHDNPELLEVE